MVVTGMKKKRMFAQDVMLIGGKHENTLLLPKLQEPNPLL